MILLVLAFAEFGFKIAEKYLLASSLEVEIVILPLYGHVLAGGTMPICGQKSLFWVFFNF